MLVLSSELRHSLQYTIRIMLSDKGRTYGAEDENGLVHVDRA